ncbi:MAG: amidohydrolase family protein [Lentisphaeria bacterium]|nr:amidohydrolase family protein [Lentisphaeria bacterium]NQZ70118.1 amidohydrolase family protein [Lentisphaeria bacterium]
MASDLSEFIQNISIHNTHEHMNKEPDFLQSKPDVLCALFDNYVPADLRTALISEEALGALLDKSNPDIAARFNGAKEAWEHCRFTGYGEIQSWIAKHFFDVDELTGENLAAAQEKLPETWDKGYLYSMLKEDANFEHIQTDDFCVPCAPDLAGPDFFLYDLSWVNFCGGKFDVKQVSEASSVEITNLDTLREAMAALFDEHAACSIAVKSQHAYGRTLEWIERDEADVAKVLDKKINGTELTVEDELCIGDWAWARGVELSIKHNLPFKIHTGHYAGNNSMQINRINAAHLCPLLLAYPEARFVLMHISYPYQDELLSIAKHFPNVWVDMCWAWSINPHSSAEFLRGFIHSVPINKLFGFGGDSFHPHSSVAYGQQTRNWLTRALQQEVDEGMLTETEAIHIAQRILQDNQMDCFDLVGTRAAIREKS